MTTACYRNVLLFGEARAHAKKDELFPRRLLCVVMTERVFVVCVSGEK